MEPTDRTIEILKDIRTEIRSTRQELSQRIDATNTRLDATNTLLDAMNTRVDATNTRLDATNTRLDATNTRLDATNMRIDETRSDLSQRIDLFTEGQVRLATELVAVASAVRDLSGLLREDRFLRRRVDDHETRLTAIERRGG
jgi:predicted  nucleic acid-binding Zn-ribbon protein